MAVKKKIVKKEPGFLGNGLMSLIGWLYPDITVVGAENIPSEPCILVGNHSQIHGPIMSQLRIPGDNYTWCAGQMMKWKEVAPYAYEDFWSMKPWYWKPFFKLASYAIVPFSVFIFNRAKTIPVYHDIRLTRTFRESMQRLEEGKNLIIFPECLEKNNHILYRFQDKFVDVARFYYKETGKVLSFIPMYLAPKLKTEVFGKAIAFDPAAPIGEERQRICQNLTDAITEIAVSLPRHTVIPYANIPRKDYPQNLPMEE